MNINVAVIGLGPCGLSLLQAFDKEIERLTKESKEIKFKITCFEQEKEVGGLWNYSHKTGLNEHGIKVHQSQYQHLWSNGPKECLEMLDYSFQEHFGKNVGSFPPRRVLKDYILGRVKKNKLLDGKNVQFDIRLHHHILNVSEINDGTQSNNFEIKYKNLDTNKCSTEYFTHCVVACGHFSTPNIVDFDGFHGFNGRIIHSHDYRNAYTFKNENVLIIGSSYSAEDIGLQCWKFGAKSVTISYRTNPMDFKWPKGIKEVPLLKKIVNGNKAIFIDGTELENVSSIILCTGYKHSFPFLSDDLKLKTKNVLYPKLFKGILSTNNSKLFYLGMQDQWYTFTMFDLQSHLTKDYILGNVKLPNKSEREKDINQWIKMEKEETNNDSESIKFQTNYIKDLYLNMRYPLDYCDDIELLDCQKLFEEWEHDKHKDILTYRDSCFVSKVSGVKAIKFHTPWTKSFDDSIECFVNSKPAGGEC